LIIIFIACRDGQEHKVERELALAGGRSMSQQNFLLMLN
jgi:hypothetical protein